MAIGFPHPPTTQAIATTVPEFCVCLSSAALQISTLTDNPLAVRTVTTGFPSDRRFWVSAHCFMDPKADARVARNRQPTTKISRCLHGLFVPSDQASRMQLAPSGLDVGQTVGFIMRSVPTTTKNASMTEWIHKSCTEYKHELLSSD
jgi:hypothetical protein